MMKANILITVVHLKQNAPTMLNFSANMVMEEPNYV